MRKKERIIVKYDPKFFNEDGIYTKDEWTSFYDIGKMFDNRVLTLKDYIITENNYIDFMLDCLKLSDCKFLTIEWSWEYEKKYFRSCMKKISAIDPDFNEYEYLLLVHEIESKKKISISIARSLFKLMLRESFNLCLSNQSKKIKIYAGYEYYLHVFTDIDTHILQETAERHHLHLIC